MGVISASLSKKAATAASIVLAVFAVGLVVAPAASAHHPEIVAAATCDSDVTFTSTAWEANTTDERTNAAIEISVSTDGGAFVALPRPPEYRYDTANDFQFTDTFTPTAGWSALRVRATAVAAWESGAAAGDSRTSATVTPRTDCAPPAPATASIADVTCEGHGALVQLFNPSDAPVAFTITGGPADRIVTVAAGDTDQLVVPVPTGGSATITVAADSMANVVRTVADDCGPTPAATVSGDCADGVVVVHLTNTGGAPATFTIRVTGSADVVTTVPAGDDVDVEVAVPMEATATITVSSPGMDDVTITCVDQSGGATDVRETESVPDTAVLGETDEAPVNGQLPATGSTSMPIVAAAVLALVAGFALVLTARRTAMASAE
jgi:LPXTG-motif cell wall-anchored protein